MLLSIIIPVYNTATCIRRCVESVVNQTYRELEIILIDDGSTDGSGQICEELAREDNRIQVIHKSNGGTSDARNVGLLHAKGEYVFFVDSDDAWLLQNGVERMMQYLSTREYDILLFKPVDIYANGGYYSIDDYDVEYMSAHNAQEVFEKMVYSEQFGTGTCRQAIKKDIIANNQISFPVGIKSGEDTFFSCMVWQHAQKAYAINMDMYGVYHRSNSNSTGYTIQNLLSYSYLFAYWKEEIAKHCINYKALGALMANLYVSACYNYFAISFKNRKQAWSILLTHQDLLSYAASRKSMRMHRVMSYVGIKPAILLFASYGKLKKYYNKILYPIS